MGSITWAPSATRDLERVVAYIADDSPEAAIRFREDLLGVLERLATLPRSGRVIPEKNDANFREVIFGQYRIMYRVQGEDVSILHVWHGKMDAGRRLGSERQGD